ncbi:chemotaxis-specific protein-glutamate methyltransferase CheB [bacterium]|nr:MAG: chemotaxis-specific protein-glutamate methyltransferase CheB [bacterium]
MTRVLIVEDSPVEQALLAHILNSDPSIEVAGVADDGQKALSAVERLNPDLVTMDIHMPNLNGFETTRRIMEENPLPIVIVSGSTNIMDADKTFRAMEAGALALVRKPRGVGHPDHAGDARELIKTVKAMSEVKVVKRWARARAPLPQPNPVIIDRAPAEIRAVAIGASTGGPAVLQTIISGLPADFPAPVLIVQHMSAGFMESFVAWISSSTRFPVKLGVHGEIIVPGTAYLAPDGFHMLAGKDGRITLARNGDASGLCPSVARLFRSVAEAFGQNAVGVLLTGMGRDGADELKLMRSMGAVTIVQDRESSVVFGMPGEALRLDAADYVLPPERIAGFLAGIVKPRSGGASDRKLLPLYRT